MASRSFVTAAIGLIKAFKYISTGIVPQKTGSWEPMTAGELGLSGKSGRKFFASSYNSDIGLSVFKDTKHPGKYAIAFTPITYSDLKKVFPEILPAPPQFNTDYADDFGEVYRALDGIMTPSSKLLVTGFSLGGVATNELSRSFSDHFDIKKANATFVSFGSEYVVKDGSVLNIGAANDWLFQSYNTYKKNYDDTDPALGTYDTFADLFFVKNSDVEALPSGSALRKMFEFEIRSHSDNGTWRWYFDYGNNDAKTSFNIKNHNWAHSNYGMGDALTRIYKSQFDKIIQVDDVAIFDFRDGVVSSNLKQNAFLKNEKTDRVFLFGEDTYDDQLLGSGKRDFIDGLGGNDEIFGAGGNDRIAGGRGADALGAGTGHDQLYGGRGADQFFFDRGYDVDVIKDFENDRDTIYFAKRLNAGSMKKSEFIAAFASVQNGDAVFKFGDGDRLVVDGVGNLSALKNDIAFV